MIDIGDPAHPQRLGGNPAFDALALTVNNDHVFVAAGSQGLVIFPVPVKY